MDLHFDILDAERRAILPNLRVFKEQGFYLAGGTALALMLGHRDSIDFDFFTEKEFDTKKLFSDIEKAFAGHHTDITQEEKNTLSILIDQNIRISFITYAYPLLNPLVLIENISLASLEDIGCMKLSAITGRSSVKDYVDLYFILQHTSLETLLELAKRKLPSLDELVILKSLGYFDDVRDEVILYKVVPVDFEVIKRFLANAAQKHAR
jgi:Nucleotidyl transferase AbiEii toxin, Type IV TA system